MPQLYLKEYAAHLAGKRVCIACREGILRDHFNEIVADIKFLSRSNIRTSFYHNLPNRFANQRLQKDLESKLPTTRVIRIAPDSDFYEAVLSHPDIGFKLIFLERRYLINGRGEKINTLNTARMRESLAEFGDGIGNVNFRNAMNLICEKIEAGLCERVHILPAGKKSIKNELFTVEGSGTMIADNFTEEFRQVESEEEVAIVFRILSMYKGAGYLVPRSKDYIAQNRSRFFVTEIDEIVVGCVEQKIVDQSTVELGALAISTRFRNQRIGVYTVSAFIETMVALGYSRFISLTGNPRLQALFTTMGFAKEKLPEYRERQEQSPGVPMFFRSMEESGKR